jgi:hypothetical protein
LFHVIHSKAQSGGVVGELALVNDVAHTVKKPIAGHAVEASARPPGRFGNLDTLKTVLTFQHETAKIG